MTDNLLDRAGISKRIRTKEEEEIKKSEQGDNGPLHLGILYHC